MVDPYRMVKQPRVYCPKCEVTYPRDTQSVWCPGCRETRVVQLVDLLGERDCKIELTSCACKKGRQLIEKWRTLGQCSICRRHVCSACAQQCPECKSLLCNHCHHSWCSACPPTEGGIQYAKIRLIGPDRSIWEVPVSVIAENRAEFYKDEFDNDTNKSLREDTYPYFEEGHTLRNIMEWALNEMDWDEILPHALLIKKADPDFRSAWERGDRKLVIKEKQ